MFILNYFISDDLVGTIKNPNVKNVLCDINNGKIKVILHSENDEEEYTIEYDSNRICDFTSEELCIFTFSIFSKIESVEYKSLFFDDIVISIIDRIIDSREMEHDQDDDDSIVKI